MDIRTKDTVAEWLRRPTRNRLELFRVGSSPASVVILLHSFIFYPQHIHNLTPTFKHTLQYYNRIIIPLFILRNINHIKDRP